MFFENLLIRTLGPAGFEDTSAACAAGGEILA
jgi:hypothetical protein